MYKRKKVLYHKRLLLLVGLILFSGLMAWKQPEAYAAEQTPEAVVITGKVSSDDDMPKDTEFVIHISADEKNPTAPLPEVTQVMVRKSGEFVFGPIALPEIGDYYYLITEDDGKSPGVTYDSKTVNVCVSIRYGENDEIKVEGIIASDSGWAAKCGEIEFVNSYEPGVTDTPVPEEPTPTPEAPTPTPEGLSPTPEAPTPTPEGLSPTPEAPTPTPEGPSLTPEAPTPTPKTPTSEPDSSGGGGNYGGGSGSGSGGTSSYRQQSTRAVNVKTGDDTPVALFLLMLGVTGVIIPVLVRKKTYK